MSNKFNADRNTTSSTGTQLVSVGDVVGLPAILGGKLQANSDIVMGIRKISSTYVLQPSDTSVLTSKGYVDDKISTAIVDFTGTAVVSDTSKLNLSGGTLTGDLTLATTKKVISDAAPTNSNDLCNKTYTDSKLKRDGSEAFGGNLSMGAYRISQPAAPSLNEHLANKAYADLKLSLTGGSLSGNLTMGSNIVHQTTTDRAGVGTQLVNLTLLKVIEAETIGANALKLDKSGGTMTGTLNLGSNQATTTAAPNSDNSLCNRSYVETQDALKLDKAGGTISGNLNINGALATTAINAGAYPIYNTFLATADDHIVNRAAMNTAITTAGDLKLSKNGGVMSGALNMYGFQLVSSYVPASGSDVVNKTYSDDTNLTTRNISGHWVSKGIVDMNNNRLISQHMATDAYDAINKSYCDTAIDDVAALKVSKSGDNMTGNLNMGANRVSTTATVFSSLECPNVDKVDGMITTALSGKLNKSGDSMSGNLTMNGTSEIICATEPTTDSSLANRLYVETGLATKMGFEGDAHITGFIDMGANKLSSSYVPDSADCVVNKLYADRQRAYCRVWRRSSSQTIYNDAIIKVVWDTTVSNLGSYVIDPIGEYIQVPNTGMYMINYKVALENALQSANMDVSAYLQINYAVNQTRHAHQIVRGGRLRAAISGSTTLMLNAGDKIYLCVWQSNTSAHSHQTPEYNYFDFGVNELNVLQII